MAILLSDNELDLLSGLPHLSIVLYVKAIRPRMDIRTGKVGIRPRISWQALKEWVYVEPVPGVPNANPSISALRRAAAWLERVGLVEIQGDSNARTLVFWCKQAEIISLVQNQADRRPTAYADTSKASPDQGFSTQADRAKTTQADKHRREVYTPSTESIASSSTTVVDGDDAMKSLEPKKPKPTAPQVVPGTTTPADQPAVKASSEGSDLIWPLSLSDQQRAAIAGKVKAMGERRQVIVDELAGFMQRPGKPIENPIRYVDFIIQKAALPVWFPEYAGKISDSRKRAAAIRREPEAPQAPRIHNPEAAAAALAILKPRKATA